MLRDSNGFNKSFSYYLVSESLFPLVFSIKEEEQKEVILVS